MERMEKHRPEWSRFDTLRSLRDLGQVALDELANSILITASIKTDDEEKDPRYNLSP